MVLILYEISESDLRKIDELVSQYQQQTLHNTNRDRMLHTVIDFAYESKIVKTSKLIETVKSYEWTEKELVEIVEFCTT